MKVLSRLLIAPLTMVVWLCAGLLYLSAPLFGLVSAVLSVLAVVVILTAPLTNGIILLMIAFLVSPVGVPMLAAKLLGGVNSIRNAFINHI